MGFGLILTSWIAHFFRPSMRGPADVDHGIDRVLVSWVPRDLVRLDSGWRQPGLWDIWKCPKIGVPLVIIHFDGVFHYKPTIWEYPILGNPQFIDDIDGPPKSLERSKMAGVAWEGQSPRKRSCKRSRMRQRGTMIGMRERERERKK